MHLRSALHLVVMALNFVHAGLRPIPAHLLQRPPNAAHISVFKRVSGYLRACCRLGASVPFCAGRRGTHLVARQGELLDFLVSAGLGEEGYGHVAKVAISRPPFSIREQSPGTDCEAPSVPHRQDGPDILRPYRPLQAEAIVLHGEANWDIGPYLGPEMLLAFKEPAVLRTFSGTGGPTPSFSKEDPAEVLKLLKVWDAKSLLRLCPGPLEDQLCSRVFGAYKSPGCFRQIGDRRGPNALEAKLDGVSRELPQGFLLTRLCLPRFTHQLRGSSTDRKDFYSQCRVSVERSLSNAVKPTFCLRDFVGTRAYKQYQEWVSSSLHLPCLRRLLHSSPPSSPSQLLDLDCVVHGCFGALFQGDAAGVELATAAHASFLEEGGVLPDCEHGRLLARHPVATEGPWAGIVIDDFFSVSVEPVFGSSSSGSASERIVRRAKQCYDGAGVLGSDNKDVFGASVFTLAGAECDSSPAAVKEGLVTVACPAQKRLALALVSLRAASSRVISQELASMLSGSWVSALMFRRPAMAIADKIFGLGSGVQTWESGSRLIPLVPEARQELVLLAVLSPLLATNVAAPFSETVRASDASMAKGAFTRLRVPRRLASALWQAADSKGFYTRLDNPLRASLASLGQEPVDSFCVSPPVPAAEVRSGVPRPVGQRFDFILVGGGPPRLPASLSERGFACGPCVSPEFSAHFDLASPDCVEWLMFLLTSGRLRSLALFVPSGALSVLRSPAKRRNPDACEPRRRLGFQVACSCLALFWVAWRCGVPSLLLCSGTSSLLGEGRFSYVASLPKVELIRVSACAQRACHPGSLALLAFGLEGLDLAPLEPPGCCLAPPLGESRKPGFCPKLVASLSLAFASVLDSYPPEPAPKRGLESLLVNDLLAAGHWRPGVVWSWKEAEHINVLEAKALLRAIRDAAQSGEDQRLVVVTDSGVTLGAACKGRSSTRALGKVLKRIASVQLACGLQVGVIFGPTRLNVADDPTRSTPLRAPSPFSLCSLLRPADVYHASTFKQLSRPSANWLRLACLVVGFRSSEGLGGFLRALSSPERVFRPLSLPSCKPDPPKPCSLFDQTLGFPGEGPRQEPAAREAERRDRRATLSLAPGRPVLPRTRQTRERFLARFDEWLVARGSSFSALAGTKPLDVEALGSALTAYGRELFDSGKPYYHFSECINAVAAALPSVRRQLQQPWDLAFSWLALEPYTHHVPMPAVLLLATLSCCLLWGWLREAGIFALCWGGILRIGEATGARRADLILPSDVLGLQKHALLRIQEPKTRLRVARHQAAKVEQLDLVHLIGLAFSELPAGTLLWDRSQQTLRKRLDSVLTRLGVTTPRGGRPIDLGSFRPGGATHLLQITEDSELVRRRGRWISPKVMEIYLQEVASVVLFPSQPYEVRCKILAFAQLFPELLAKADLWTRQKLPHASWFALFSSGG